MQLIKQWMMEFMATQWMVEFMAKQWMVAKSKVLTEQRAQSSKGATDISGVAIHCLRIDHILLNTLYKVKYMCY